VKIDYYLKALAGALTAALAALGGMLTAPESSLATVTAGQWIAVALAFLGGLGLTYAIPNAPKPPTQVPVETGSEAYDDLLYEGQGWHANGTTAYTPDAVDPKDE
jgi:hypothetical protein